MTGIWHKVRSAAFIRSLMMDKEIIRPNPWLESVALSCIHTHCTGTGWFALVTKCISIEAFTHCITITHPVQSQLLSLSTTIIVIYYSFRLMSSLRAIV